MSVHARGAGGMYVGECVRTCMRTYLEAGKGHVSVCLHGGTMICMWGWVPVCVVRANVDLSAFLGFVCGHGCEYMSAWE